MTITRFWLIRHALVEETARASLYGQLDVPLCPERLVSAAPIYAALVHRLPRPARWLCSPLSRTRLTAEAIFRAGYPETPLETVPDLIEQDFGELQGLSYDEVPERLRHPRHDFWPMAAWERAPGGESMADVIARVGACLETLAGEMAAGERAEERGRFPRRDAPAYREVVAATHGGTIRAAVAHALGLDAERALRLQVQNLSLTVLERHPRSWSVACVNEVPGV